MNKNNKKSLEEEYSVVPLNGSAILFFSSFDLGLASALVSVGFSLISLDRKNLHKTRFIFQRESGLDEAVDAYWSNNLDIKARAYFDNLKMLKNRLNSQ